MAFNFTIPLRIAQFILAIIVLGLTGYSVGKFNGFWWGDWSPDSVRFLLFCSIWTLFALIYLVLAPWKFPSAAHKFAILGVEAITNIFWFAGWIALAAWLGDVLDGADCGGNNLCGSLKAAAVFGAFEWICFMATLVLCAIHVYRTRGTANNEAPPQMQAQPHAVA